MVYMVCNRNDMIDRSVTSKSWNNIKILMLCSDWIDLEPFAIVSGNNHCSHCSSDSISNRFNFLLSSGHVPSAGCCLDIIMADLANRVFFMLICILNAMIVDFRSISMFTPKKDRSQSV
jgi:hypothetical protein